MDLKRACKEMEKIGDGERKLYNRERQGIKKGIQVIRKKREEICEELKESFELTETNIHVIALRKKIMEHKELALLLEKYNIAIEDMALVWHVNESWDFDLFLQFNNEYADDVCRHSRWANWTRFLYGGPKSPVQVFFDRVPGKGLQFSGVYLKREVFPKGGVFKLFEKAEKTARV